MGHLLEDLGARGIRGCRVREMSFTDVPDAEFFPLKPWRRFPNSKPAVLPDVRGRGEKESETSSSLAVSFLE